MKKERTEKQKAAAEKLRQFQFKPGQSGNPEGAQRKKPLSLSDSYKKALREIDPESGKSHAELIATLIVQAAISGDVHALLMAVSNDSKGLVKKAIEGLVNKHQCSRQQAKLALSLFIPEVII